MEIEEERGWSSVEETGSSEKVEAERRGRDEY